MAIVAKSFLKVAKFNQEADRQYRKAVEAWKSEQGGFPYRPMYVFQTPEGTDRKRGFVVSEGNSHYFYLTRHALQEASQ